jgi:hypothetical protein
MVITIPSKMKKKKYTAKFVVYTNHLDEAAQRKRTKTPTTFLS